MDHCSQKIYKGVKRFLKIFFHTFPFKKKKLGDYFTNEIAFENRYLRYYFDEKNKEFTPI